MSGYGACNNACGTLFDYDICLCPPTRAEMAKLWGWWSYEPELYGKRPKPQPLPDDIEMKFRPYEGLYELTLTTNKDDPHELKELFGRITRSAMFAVKGYIACIELTKAGLPHIHALLFSSKKYIDASKIKSMYPYRYECKRVRLPGRYYEYINKDVESAATIDYCKAKGIVQVWDSVLKKEVVCIETCPNIVADDTMLPERESP